MGDPTATTVPMTPTVPVERARADPARWGTGRDLSVDLVDANANVNVGNTVVTNGIDAGLAPADIPVGRVSSVRRFARLVSSSTSRWSRPPTSSRSPS